MNRLILCLSFYYIPEVWGCLCQVEVEEDAAVAVRELPLEALLQRSSAEQRARAGAPQLRPDLPGRRDFVTRLESLAAEQGFTIEYLKVNSKGYKSFWIAELCSAVP